MLYFLFLLRQVDLDMQLVQLLLGDLGGRAHHHVLGVFVHGEGNDLPDDFICPLCKHPASDFEKVVKKTEV